MISLQLRDDFHCFEAIVKNMKLFRWEHVNCESQDASRESWFVILSAEANKEIIRITQDSISSVQEVYYEPDSLGNLIKRERYPDCLKLMGFRCFIGKPLHGSMILGCYGCGESTLASTQLAARGEDDNE